MKAVFLGTGTSHGIPMIGCSCEICRSTHPKNKRRRCSLYVVAAGQHLVFDTPPDFREQVLAFGVEHVDAVFLTHPHADHIFGFDDIRRFCALQKQHIPVYGSAETIRQMRCKFDYVDQQSHSFGGVPRVVFTEMDKSIDMDRVCVVPLPVWHGEEMVYGFLVESDGKRLGYIPDCNGIPEETLQCLENMDVMILDGLRPKKHPTHFSIEECVDMLNRIGARQSFVTHLTHDSDHEELQGRLGDAVTVPWDGFTIRI